MRFLLSSLFSLLLYIIPAAAQIAVSFPDTIHAWTVDELPMPQLINSLNYTVNPDEAMSSEDVDTLDVISYALRDQFGIEMVCVCVGRVAGGDVYAWGDSLFTKYGFGKKGTDNGLLVVISVVDREWRIFPGKGLEGILPDAVCNRIGNRVMLPYLKEQQWGRAMVAAAKVVYGILKEAPEYAEFTNFEEESDDDLSGALGVIGALGLGMGAAAYFGRKKCPRCKAFMKTQSRTLISHIGAVKTYEVTYVCPKCGNVLTTTEKVNIADSAAAAAAGAASSRSWSSGGGFRGGSFGGGSFGGGGAGGRF